MKKLVIIILTAVTLTNCASATIIEPETFKQEKIIDIPNESKDNLFITANDWMVSTFNNAESVIQFSDKSEGTIIGKYLLSGTVYTLYGSTNDTRLFAKITVQVKDNKARILVIPTSKAYIYKEQQKLNTEKAITNIINDFSTAITSKQTTDW